MNKKTIQKINNIAIGTLAGMMVLSSAYAGLMHRTDEKKAAAATAISFLSTALLAGYVRNKENFK